MRAWVLSLLTVLLTTLLACGDSGGAKAPTRPLPPYSGRPAQMFDDSFDAAAVGLDMDNSYHPKSDAQLRERAQSADAVLRVKVTTVTNKVEDTGPTFEVGLKQTEWIAGDHPPGADNFSIRMQKSQQTTGMMKSLEGRLVGMEFIVFLKAFKVGESADHEFHVHFAPASKDVKDAVGDAIALRELK
jgi:hypothetical protein